MQNMDTLETKELQQPIGVAEGTISVELTFQVHDLCMHHINVSIKKGTVNVLSYNRKTIEMSPSTNGHLPFNWIATVPLDFSQRIIQIRLNNETPTWFDLTGKFFSFNMPHRTGTMSAGLVFVDMKHDMLFSDILAKRAKYCLHEHIYRFENLLQI